jgi:hypothetical protein
MKIKLLFIFSLLFFLGFIQVEAQEIIVDYKNQPVVDSDLDGITDEGEKQIYKTDSNNPDTDGDGIYDGVEAANGTDPMGGTLIISGNPEKIIPAQKPTKSLWKWYIAGSAILFLLATIFLPKIFRRINLKKY